MGDGFMGTKGMLQLCTPFVTAVVVIISFYMLGGVYLLLGLLLDELGLYIGYDEVADFLFLFGWNPTTGGWICAIIIWILLTVFFEMRIAENIQD